jgi:hypothetical protein
MADDWPGGAGARGPKTMWQRGCVLWGGGEWERVVGKLRVGAVRIGRVKGCVLGLFTETPLEN